MEMGWLRILVILLLKMCWVRGTPCVAVQGSGFNVQRCLGAALLERQGGRGGRGGQSGRGGQGGRGRAAFAFVLRVYGGCGRRMEG